MARVVSVNISEKKGTLKKPVPEIELKLRHGIVGDAHAGDWHRQISLLAEESIDTMRPRSPIALDPGVFAENINTEGIDLKGLPVGTHLRIGETEVEMTQIGKECHSDCAIKQAVGRCVMPTEGIFAVVVREGVVRPGDEIEILEAEPEKTKSLKRLILQPRNAPEKLRKWLLDHGYRIVDEILVREGKFIWEIMVAEAHEMAEAPQKEQYDIGDLLIEKRDPLLLEFLQRKIAIEEAIIRNTRLSDSDSALSQRRVSEKKLELFRRIEKDVCEQKRAD